MAIINQGIVEAANLAVRTLQLAARQAATTTSSVITAATPSVTPSPTPSDLPSSTSSAATTSDTTSLNGGTSNSTGNGNGNGGGQSSPLLFFVALGFGVVFTNLWIIVGVKYCFRYNARNRQMRMTGEDGEPITLENMPQNPRRRRREKKLMTMDEVNEKFPMTKYKSWVASRAHEGLPTRGGVSLPPSRANSLRDADGIIPDLPNKERDSIEERPVTSSTSIAKQMTLDPKSETAADTPGTGPDTTTDGQTTTDTTAPNRTTSPDSMDQDDEEDDHIDAALPPEALEAAAGDTCAICIDTLEDDDDVRGLTCGHAFHAVCLDPWLTSRRACCPLCKADYYTPKPRPAAAGETGEGTQVGPTVAIAQDPRTNRMNMPSRPGVAWVGLRGRGLPVRFVHGNADDSNAQRNNNGGGRQRGGFFSRSRPSQPAQAPVTGAPEVQSSQNGNRLMDNIRHHIFYRPRQSESTQNQTGAAPPAGANSQVTPSNLEAGVRP